MPSLFVIQGRDQGSRFDLDGPAISVGRVATNTIQLHDTEVSREHAQLERVGDTYLFRDLGSSNGSFINRQSVSEHRLASGDQIQLGKTLLLYTGVPQEQPDLSGEVDIVASSSRDDESRILHAVAQGDSGDLLLGPSDDQASPWLARRAATCRSCIARRWP